MGYTLQNEFSIGSEQSDNISRVASLADSLSQVTSANFAGSIREEAEVLRDWRARVAVIGQVKAGKSTFINALIGHPGFVPTDVNPWTAAVTNIHFAHPKDPTAGGAFHFFSEEEWKRLYDGDVEAREMAEELLPGFQSDVLHEQVMQMRDRARARLGRLYHHLHGKSHKFDVITPDLLSRYVCAGPEAAEGEKAELVGRYSDITKSADIFQPAGIFKCPTVVIDTPGVNDPFLVRDELTCQSLRIADVYVVVLSVHQALSEVDQGLIRMLASEGAKDVIIYINRVDELEDAGAEISAIQDKVRDTLKKAYADIQLTIHVGSAMWGEIALRGDADAIAAALASDAARTRMEQYEGELPDEPWARLFVLSGLADVRAAINEGINVGAGTQVLKQSASSLQSIIQASESLATQQIDGLEGELGKTGDDADYAAAIRERIEVQSMELEAAVQAIEDVIRETEKNMQDRNEDFFRSLRLSMTHTANAFIEEQTIELKKLFEAKTRGKTWQLETGKIRHSLEEKVILGYGPARSQEDRILQAGLEKARKALGTLMPGSAIAIDTTTLPHNDVKPIAPAIPQTLTLELTSKRGWKFWKSSNMSVDEALKAMRRVIRSEVHPSVEQLCMSAEVALAERVAAATRRMKNVLSGILENLKDQKTESESELAELETIDPSIRVEEMRRRLEVRLNDMRDARAQLTDHARELTFWLDSDESGDKKAEAAQA